jgi:hypothetical protein
MAVEAVTSEPVSAGIFPVAAKFPKQKNREFSRENGEFPQRIREGP